MRALRRLLLLIFLSGLSFLVINPMVNYLFLATDSVKFIKTGTPVGTISLIALMSVTALTVVSKRRKFKFVKKG